MKKFVLSLFFFYFSSFFLFTCLAAQGGQEFYCQQDSDSDCTPIHTPPLSRRDPSSYDSEECVLISDADVQANMLPESFIAHTICPKTLVDTINIYINGILKHSKYRPDQYLVILDFDGTITNKVHPNDQGDLAFRVGNMKDWIVNLRDAGIHVLISSAWNQSPWTDATGFHHTCERLTQLGLDDVFFLNQEHPYQETALETATVNDAEISFIKAGHVCSVIRGGAPVENKYFFNKAFAGACVLGEKVKELKCVIFLDDTHGNIDCFKKDVARYDLFPCAGVYSYSLDRDKKYFEIDEESTLRLPF